MKTINAIIPAFLEILAICYFGEIRMCLGIPDHNQQNSDELTITFINAPLCKKLICCFLMLWTSHQGMPDLIQQKLHNQTIATMNI